MARLSEMLALRMGFPPDQAALIYRAAEVHDIGKLAISDSILNKPSQLTPYEFEIIKSHTKIGAKMLSAVPGNFGKMARLVAELHHEQWLGGGYWGIPASRLPIYIPIVTVVDVYVACRSIRPYKAPWSREQALDYLRAYSGTQFSPEIVDVFVQMILESDDDILFQTFCPAI